MKNLHLSLLFLFLFPGFASGQDVTDKIRAIVHKYDSLDPYNGIIIIGLTPGHIITLQYGYKNILNPTEKISMTDRFDLASLTKQFTGLAILQLLEKKAIHENDSISRYIPELKPGLGKVSIKQLANHTNGIPDFYSLTGRPDTLNNEKVLQILYRIDSTVFQPGTAWGYSNSGYLLLSTIIERVSKLSFQEYCYKHILKPLGMDSARFAPAFPVLYGFSTELKPITFNTFSSGESGLYATGNDMVSYYKTYSRQKKWKKYLRMSERLSEKSNTEHWNYGFGWYLSKDSLASFRAHSGRNTGADTYIKWYDEKKLFICLLANKRLKYFKELREEISNLVAAEVK